MELHFPDAGEKYNFPDDLENFVFIEEFQLDVEGYVQHLGANKSNDYDFDELTQLFEIYVHEQVLADDPGQVERCMYWSLYAIGEWADDPRVPLEDSIEEDEAVLLGDTGWLLLGNTIYVGVEVL